MTTFAAIMDFFFQVLIIGFSVMAGIYWVRSAEVKLPNITANLTWDGRGAFPEALAEQAKYNVRAARCAACAAIVQALVFTKPFLQALGQ